MKPTRCKAVGPRVRCNKCGDIIQSKHVHDFVRCECGAIFIDGGGEYTRCGGNLEDFDWEMNGLKRAALKVTKSNQKAKKK